MRDTEGPLVLSTEGQRMCERLLRPKLLNSFETQRKRSISVGLLFTLNNGLKTVENTHEIKLILLHPFDFAW